jgi:hypothetical protein
MLPLWRKYHWFSEIVLPHAEVRLGYLPVVGNGFGPMVGRTCGNTGWYNEYETIFAIFRASQQGFLGDWLKP